MPLSLFATARGHWAERECCLLVLNLVSSTLFWLRVSIERHCQFSREASLHRAKKNEGSCTPSLGYLLSPLASHTLKWMHVCAGGRGNPSPFPHGFQQSAARLASCWRSVCSELVDRLALCGSVANIVAEELEPLWLAALLLRVPEAKGRYISLHSARPARD